MEIKQIMEYNMINIRRCTGKQRAFIRATMPFYECKDVKGLYITKHDINNQKYTPKYSCTVYCWDKDKNKFRCSYTFGFSNRNRLRSKIKKLQAYNSDIICQIISINSFN